MSNIESRCLDLSEESPFKKQPELWDESDFHNLDNVYSEEQEPNESEETEAMENEESNENKKEVTKKGNRKKLKANEDTIYKSVSKSNDYKLVLHALYVHRRLSISQIVSLFFVEAQKEKVNNMIRKTFSFGLLERKRIYSVAQTPAEARTYHYSLSAFGIKVYALVCMNIRMLHGDPDLPKQHYSQSDLSIGSQADHHYLLQGFLCETLGTLWRDGVYVPNCEWRRYLYLDAMNEVPYRPDWIFHEPNPYYSNLVQEKRVGEDILSVPVLTRNEQDLSILKEHYRPLLSIECDTGAMKLKTLQAKCVRIQNEKQHIPKGVAILVGDTNLGEERTRERWNESKTRIRNIGQAVTEVLEKELLQNEFDIFIGRKNTLSDTVTNYVKQSGVMKKLFTSAEASLRKSVGKQKWLLERVWKERKIETGFPDMTLEQTDGSILAYYFAYPGWINPQVKIGKLLNQTSDDVKGVLVYLRKDHFYQEAVFIGSNRLSFLALDEWGEGERSYYRREVDRSGERWEVKS
jgi:hypothetical protein